MDDDLQHGLGHQILPNGTSYKGLFTAGKKGPSGVIMFHNGNVY